VLIATFQRLSLLIPEAQRYEQIAPRLNQTFALGVPDVALDPIPGVTVLPLAAGDPLTEEWVVIASGPTCCAALFSRDTEGFRLNRRSRRFAGYWTTGAAEVDKALRRFYQAIGREPPAIRREPGAGVQRFQSGCSTHI
jgi:DICT domain-containing protein